jgi:hypothetical protein
MICQQQTIFDFDVVAVVAVAEQCFFHHVRIHMANRLFRGVLAVIQSLLPHPCMLLPRSLLVVVLPTLGDIIAYTHGLHFCQEAKAMHENIKGSQLVQIEKACHGFY